MLVKPYRQPPFGLCALQALTSNLGEQMQFSFNDMNFSMPEVDEKLEDRWNVE